MLRDIENKLKQICEGSMPHYFYTDSILHLHHLSI